MAWSAVDVLVLGSNTGEVLLAIASSEEAVLKGFRASDSPIKFIAMDSRLQYMAVVTGKQEVSFFEFEPSSAQWHSLVYLPSDERVPANAEITSIHWDPSFRSEFEDHSVQLVVSYDTGYIMTWCIDFAEGDATVIRSAQIAVAPIYAGHLSPNGSLFVYQSPEPGLQVCDLALSSQAVSFVDSENTIEYPRNIRFMYSGDWLLTSGKGKLSLWHVASRTSARTIDLDRRIHPPNVVIINIKLDKDRRAILDRKDRNKSAAAPGGEVEVVD
ncbi:hypothetical protein EST38_g3509 [Candolleomyces aberdarensis]|uniref:Uncharacterized protein n=1 Tax=Candolleomyces aberdarensis TaxID=2316362 RepID=A0A4Q2DS04_9AGAR|nr:hypothetical protein EST38_g3509 [Candolleomyces aberdarensis]